MVLLGLSKGDCLGEGFTSWKAGSVELRSLLN
jgi:hypothetical protein